MQLLIPACVRGQMGLIQTHDVTIPGCRAVLTGTDPVHEKNIGDSQCPTRMFTLQYSFDNWIKSARQVS